MTSLAPLLLAVTLFSAEGAAQVDAIAQRVDAYLDRIETEGASGVVLVAVGDDVKLRRGIGWADCSGQEPLSADHLVLIGSITKEFTQLLSYVLAEEEALSFADPIGRYLPSLPREKAAITVGQLVTHTSGLPDLVDASGRQVPYSVAYDYLPVSRDEMIRRAGVARPRFAPGKREEYSNLGYNLLGALLEIASGESYERLLSSRIFEPAGMRDTGYYFHDRAARRYASGCSRGGRHWGSPIADEMWDAEGPSWNLKAAGGLLSTVDDLSRWFAALGTGKLLGANMQARYLDDRLVESQRFRQRVMGPAGSNGIFNSVAYWAESTDIRVAIVTTRSSYQVEAEGMHREIIRAASEYVPGDR